MKTITKNIEYPSRSDTFKICPLFDVHLGSLACDEKLLKRDIAEIERTKNALVILGGDMIDAVNHMDTKRYVPSKLAPWCRGSDDVMMEQIDMLTKYLAPIRDKIVAVIEGNHESAASKHNARSIFRDICGRIAGLDGRASQIALGVEGFLVLRFVRKSPGQKVKGASWPMVIYARHGYGGGRKKGGKINNLADLLYAYDCDLALSGHIHDKLYTSVVRTGPSRNGGFVTKEIHGVSCGTYLSPYIAPTKQGMPQNTYGQRGGYFPSTLGRPRITVRPSKRQMSITFDSMAGVAEFDMEAA